MESITRSSIIQCGRTLGMPEAHRRERTTTSQPVTYYWNMFDQVLIRPSLIDCFRNDSLKILDSDGMQSLTRTGRPEQGAASDHLPILFGLEL